MKSFAVCASVLALLATTHTAHAIGPVDIEIAARAGSATSPGSDFPASPYGFGIGGRAGIGVVGIYAGISGMYYLGNSVPLENPLNGGSASSNFHTAMEGFELGYTFKPPFVWIRPQVGVGNATLSFNSTSFSNLYVEPGVVLEFPIGPLLVGGDVNALMLPGFTAGDGSKTYVSLSAHGQVGVHF